MGTKSGGYVSVLTLEARITKAQTTVGVSVLTPATFAATLRAGFLAGPAEELPPTRFVTTKARTIAIERSDAAVSLTLKPDAP